MSAHTKQADEHRCFADNARGRNRGDTREIAPYSKLPSLYVSLEHVEFANDPVRECTIYLYIEQVSRLDRNGSVAEHRCPAAGKGHFRLERASCSIS